MEKGKLVTKGSDELPLLKQGNRSWGKDGKENVCAYVCVLLCFDNKSKKRTADKKASDPLKGLQLFDLNKMVFSWVRGMYAVFFPH